MPTPPQKSFFPLPEAPRMPRRRPDLLAKVVSTLGIIGVLALVALVVAVWRFDINSYKPRIEEAVRAATGRDFVIQGKLSVLSYFSGTVAADKVVLGNVRGAADRDMIKIARVEADVGLRALLAGHIEISRLVVIAPDVLMEVDKDGVANWHFPLATPTAAAVADTAAATAARLRVGVRTLHIKEGRIEWRDARTGVHTTIGVRRLSAIESDDVAQIQWVADLQLATGRLQITGQTGALLRLLDPNATTPWNIYLRSNPQGALITVSGNIRHPLSASGYDLQVSATVADPIGLAALAGIPTPPVRGMSLSMRLSDAAGHGPSLSDATLQIGPSELGRLVPGLQLDHARLIAKATDQPIQFDLRGTLDAAPLQASGSLGTLAALFGHSHIPIDASAMLGESRVEAKGSLGAPQTGEGLDLQVSARIRDLSAFNRLFPRPLPPLQDLAFTAHVLAAAGGWAHGMTMPEFALRLPQGDLSGAIALRLDGRPHAQVRLRGSTLDLDSLLDRLHDYYILPAPSGPPAAALPFARTVRPVIPDDPLDLTLLNQGDADVALDIGQLTFTGLQFKDFAATLALKDGRLLAEPVQAQLPGGGVSLRLSLDTADPAQPVQMRLHAPGLAVRPLLRLLGRTEDITGTLELDADIAAAGHSWHDWAASATGHVAAALVDGTIDNMVLVPMFSGVLRVARLQPDLLFGPGRSRLRCVALRLDGKAGIARLSTFLMDADRALVQADGSIHFGSELMELRLRPTLRVGGPGVVVPLTLRGSFRSPVLELDQAAVSGDVAAALTRLSVGDMPRGSNVEPTADQCNAALAVVRGGPTGPVPAGPPSPSVQRRFRIGPTK